MDSVHTCVELEPFLDRLPPHLPQHVGLCEVWVVIQVGLDLQPHQGALTHQHLKKSNRQASCSPTVTIKFTQVRVCTLYSVQKI
jgi:hypothetical protein